MSEQKRYTAEEMREAAGHVVSELYTNPFADMLRYAAGAVERCEEVLCDNGKRDERGRVSYCGSCICEVVNYVLRGDAEEGENDGK